MKGVKASAAIIPFTNILTVIFKTKLRLWRNPLFFFIRILLMLVCFCQLYLSTRVRPVTAQFQNSHPQAHQALFIRDIDGPSPYSDQQHFGNYSLHYNIFISTFKSTWYRVNLKSGSYLLTTKVDSTNKKLNTVLL